MKILYLCNRLYWQQKIPRTRFDAVEAIAKLTSVYCTGVDYFDWDDQLSVSSNLAALEFKPDLLMVYKPTDYFGWAENQIPVVQRFNDCWATNDRIRDIKMPRSSLVIMHHENEMPESQARMPDVTFRHIPYPINDWVFQHYAMPKTTDILLTGAIDEKIYPLRYRFARMIEQGAFLPYIAVHRGHAGYRLKEPHAEAVSYAKALNSARICLADTSKYNYAPEKYHEIPACASVLCGNLPQDRREEFKKFMIVIDPAWSDSQIVQVIKRSLGDHADLANRSIAGHQYVHRNFTCEHYARRFLAYAKEALDG